MRIAVALPCVLALAVAACTSHEGGPESTPAPKTTPPTQKTTPTANETPTKQTPVAPQVALRGAISSVSLIQNCADDDPQPPPPPAMDHKDEAPEPAAAEPAPGAVAGRIAPGARAVGNDNTYAPSYVLEVDVAFAGRTITLRSNEFQREHAHVIVT